MTVVELDYLCDMCGRLVDDGEGCVMVRHSDIATWRELDALWKQAFPGGKATSTRAILARPDPVPWRIFHDGCNPRPDLDGYDINVDRIRTHQTLLERTAELMSKSWLPVTDWHAVIGGVSGESHRVVPHGDAA